jgi:hypothetical protein
MCANISIDHLLVHCFGDESIHVSDKHIFSQGSSLLGSLPVTTYVICCTYVPWRINLLLVSSNFNGILTLYISVSVYNKQSVTLLHLIPFWRKVAGVLLFLEKYIMHESFLERLVSFSYAVLFHNNFGWFGPATFFFYISIFLCYYTSQSNISI